MRRTYLTGSLAFTALFWLFNYFSGSLNLISYWYVLFGFLMSGLVNHHDYDRQIPQWFTGCITLGAALGAWMLLNYPTLFLLALVSIQVYAAGSFREAMEDFFDFLLEVDSIGSTTSASSSSSRSGDNNRNTKAQGGGGGGGGSIALVMDVTKTPLSPSQSLRQETENLTRLCTIKAASDGFSSNSVVEADRVADSRAPVAIPPLPPPPAAPPAAAAAAVVVPTEEKVVVGNLPIVVVDNSLLEADKGEMTDDSDTDTPSPALAPLLRHRSHFPTLPLHSRQAARDLMNQYYDSDSTSDSDHGGRSLLSTRRGVRELHINRKFSRNNDRMSRFAEQQQAQASEENVASPPMHRSFSSAGDNQSSHDYAEGTRLRPERTTRPAKSPFPELPAAFRDRFMQKSPSAISSESRNKFMRAETVRSIAATPVSRRG